MNKGKLAIRAALVAMLVLMTACGKEGGDNDASADESGDTVIVTAVRDQDASIAFKEGEDFDNNAYTRAYQDELGIKLKYDWIVPADQYDAKLNVAIASRDLPDIFKVNATQLKQLVDAGLLADLTGVYEEHASELTRTAIEMGPEAKASATFDGKSLAPDDVSLCAPITDPGKIICIGLNYHDHVIESNMQVPKQPVLFPKYNNALVGPDDDVIITEDTQQCDYEVELAFIVGKRAKRVPIVEAMDYIFGSTIMNDVSARDIQLSEGQWTRGKTIDTFGPIGPCIATADEIPDPQNLRISLKLNGETMQDGTTKELIFNVPYLLSFLSRTMTLEPGDIVSTGTPPGVGMGRTPQVWLKPGDVTEATIEGIGTLRNFFKAENE